MTAIYAKQGVCSITEDERHILMFDIDIDDIVYEKKISSMLRILQKENQLSDIYLFKTKNGYHAWCLDKMSLREAYQIYLKLQVGDDNHRYLGFWYRKHWVLRIGSDIKLIEVIRAFPEDRPNMRVGGRSNSHRMFLNLQYDAKIPGDLTFDNSTKILTITYPQRAKGHAVAQEVPPRIQ